MKRLPRLQTGTKMAKPKHEHVSRMRIPRLLPRWIATAGGLGYLPLMPGTFGSFGGVALYTLALFLAARWYPPAAGAHITGYSALWLTVPLTLFISVIGIWASGVDAREMRLHDPQFIVIDEVSGQLIALVAGLAPLNWKYSLAGFILFRVFDIWKPFPIRQAEHLPDGWGIMSDDWLAGIYAAICLLLLRYVKF